MARIMQHEWMTSGACEAIEVKPRMRELPGYSFRKRGGQGVCDLSMSQRAKR
jgi:hypothetical protein